MSNLTEIVFVNGGEIYKERYSFVKQEIRYVDSSGGAAAPSSREENGGTKRYLRTADYMESAGALGGVDLKEYDLSPSVSLWLGVGKSDNGDFDLYFHVGDSSQLKACSEYYGLPYPLDGKWTEILDAQLESYRYAITSYGNIFVGGVKFSNGIPVLMKMYFHPRAMGMWDEYMMGSCYEQGGALIERGCIYHQNLGLKGKARAHVRGEGWQRYAESIVSEKANQAVVQYEYCTDIDDPLPVAYWIGKEFTKEGHIRTKRFSSSRQLRELICNLPTGSTYADYDLCPDIKFLLGHSWYEGEEIVELYFMVEGSTMLENVASYYSLPVPYDAELKEQIDHDPAAMRIRYYDILSEGPGKFVPVVVAGVEFTNEKATALRLYSFSR